MSKAFLIFCSALLAMMAGALFYAARIPVQNQAPSTEIAEQGVAQETAETVPVPTAPDVVMRPSFALPDVDGNDHHISEWDGKNRILNFWATWCAPCRREIPLLKAFQDEQSGNGFQVIGIAVDFPEEVGRYAETAEFNYPILVGQQEAMAVAETSGIEFMALPFTMFIASNGEYLNAYMGELHAEQLATVVDVMTKLDRNEISAEDARLSLDRL